ncbi:transcription factor MYC2-like [Hibiscus syriacus]|uniref:Transcription factor MYC2-like n=1 Tax=Hibiscus syriacus TaxID=106335 RepID=A0A6A2ZEH4_HIBSY|nr:transcription factor MYC2-like [Hibiscus syriacus]
MIYGGNNRAQVFFKQHGWSDGGKIEAKYTSRAAYLYRQLLSKEVAKSMAEEAGLPTSPVASQSPQAPNGLLHSKIDESPKESSLDGQEKTELPPSPKASHKVVTSTIKKPLGAKRTGKTGGLGARKLTSKVENNQSSELNSRGPQILGDVAPPKSSSFAEFGMDSGSQKKASSKVLTMMLKLLCGNSRVQQPSPVPDLFGQSADSSIDLAASDLINRLSFQAQQDISNLKNIAGETGKKLSSLASTLMSDLQDRIL